MKKKYNVLMIALLVVIVMSAVIVQASGYQKITPQEGKHMLDSDPSIKLLDVRNSWEYEQGHIPNSILLPMYQIEDEVETLIPDKDTKIIVYCRSGRRSKLSANKLISMGYTNVYDMGGILDWPYEIVK
ncbi:rhodanese-like domain-containing protein [Clostridiaceae bacterium M8S5]|nr:rhodanese-like domain-containing protein [Clostridiaceae bacterium M8S5]